MLRALRTVIVFLFLATGGILAAAPASAATTTPCDFVMSISKTGDFPASGRLPLRFRTAAKKCGVWADRNDNWVQVSFQNYDSRIVVWADMMADEIKKYGQKHVEFIEGDDYECARTGALCVKHIPMNG